MGKIIRGSIIVFCLTCLIVGNQGCGRRFGWSLNACFDIPRDKWSKMSAEQKHEAVKEYFEIDKAILIFCLVSKGPLRGGAEIYKSDRTERWIYSPNYFFSTVFISSKSSREHGKVLDNLLQNGFYIFEINSGENTLRIFPADADKISSKHEIVFNAQPGTIINFGEIVMTSARSQSPKPIEIPIPIGEREYKEYVWGCNAFYSVAPVDSFKKVYPEIYEVFKKKIVEKNRNE